MLTLPQLEAHLWQAAQLLRGFVDSGDFKQYILGLLFFKRLCDVWDEDQRSCKARFEIPKGHHWRDLARAQAGLGDRVHEALAAIERCNPALRGLFRGLDLRDSQRFPDHLLRSLLAHFDLHRLGHAQVEQDLLGRAYEYLIAKFADDAGRKGGEFYTPTTVATLLVQCLAPKPGMRLYDPTCGSGGMLLQAARYAKAQDQDKQPLHLSGQEKNLNTWAICKMNMFLHGHEHADIRSGDTLQNPAHLGLQAPPKLQVFDRVIANPPFSLKAWGAQRWREGDLYQRAIYGCPPENAADFAFIQHMLASLAPQGVMAVVLPCGVLFREKTEGKIRTKLVQADHLEAVIALPRNLFYGTGIPACVLIARKKKDLERKNKVLFVDATDLANALGKRDELSSEGIARVTALYHDWSLSDEIATQVSLEEIEENGYNLTVQRYVHRPVQEPFGSVADLQALKAAHAARELAEALLFQELEGLGYL